MKVHYMIQTQGLPVAPNTITICYTHGYIWCSLTAYGVSSQPLAIIQGSYTHSYTCTKHKWIPMAAEKKNQVKIHDLGMIIAMNFW